MRDGSSGTYGNPGNEESATCRAPDWNVGSNPTLTAGAKLVGKIGERLLQKLAVGTEQCAFFCAFFSPKPGEVRSGRRR